MLREQVPRSSRACDRPGQQHGNRRLWKDVLTMEADKIPADEAPVEFEREWDYPLPEQTPGRFV